MKVIIKDKFYEFQNENTDEIFNNQKQYLADLILKYNGDGKQQELLTNLLSLYNLTESLIDEFVNNFGLENTLKTLNAKEVK